MSAAPEQSAPVRAIREAVAAAVEARTVRAVAAEVDISHPGLMKFIGGAKPQMRTLRKLVAWYVQQHSAHAHLDEDVFAAALTVLVNSYPREMRERVRADLVEVLRKGLEESGVAPPPWMK